MRAAGIRGIGGLALAALAAAGAAVGGAGDDIMRRQPEPAPKKRRRVAPTFRRRAYAPWLPAGINRHTGKPHEHRRAIARATTAPGSVERAAAMAAARVPSK